MMRMQTGSGGRSVQGFLQWSHRAHHENTVAEVTVAAGDGLGVPTMLWSALALFWVRVGMSGGQAGSPPWRVPVIGILESGTNYERFLHIKKSRGHGS